MVLQSKNNKGTVDAWLENNRDLVAVSVILLGFFARVRTAFGIFLNPDEALHFRLANQLSLGQAYRESLTASHPPLLTIILYFWRITGTADLWLRMPLILASLVFCWMFYKWLRNVTGELAGLIGLIFVALLPPIVVLSTEIRQYPLLLCFLASALYFLDSAFDKASTLRMVGFSICLYLAMLSHYSAFLFAAALGVYALLRIFQERPPVGLVATWAIGQIGALGLAILLYKTHISKLGVGESRTALQGWMSEFFLRRSYFDPAHDHWPTFLIGHTFGVFQYFFGQLAIGDIAGVLFFAGIFLWLWGRSAREKRTSRRFAILLVLPFVVACSVSVAHIYPYGGTRHVAFLIIPCVAGVSVALARLASEKAVRAGAFTGVILLDCIAFGKPRPPRMDRVDQSYARMAEAIHFIEQNVSTSDIIFTDYQSDLILGHYLCGQQPVNLEPAPSGFEQFSCAGKRVVSTDYLMWQFWANNFPSSWQQFVQSYNLLPRQRVWVVQMGWGIELPEDLKRSISSFHDLSFESFGNNIKIFKLTISQPIVENAQ
jgi:hypothetical protein